MIFPLGFPSGRALPLARKATPFFYYLLVEESSDVVAFAPLVIQPEDQICRKL